MDKKDYEEEIKKLRSELAAITIEFNELAEKFLNKEGDLVFIPKGHGRIIDEAQIPDDRLAPSMDLSDRLSWAPTILKADEEEESEV